jgi:hypothetical protein
MHSAMLCVNQSETSPLCVTFRCTLKPTDLAAILRPHGSDGTALPTSSMSSLMPRSLTGPATEALLTVTVTEQNNTTCCTGTEEETQDPEHLAVFRLPDQSEEVPHHNKASYQHARNFIIGNWSKSSSRTPRAQSLLASRYRTGLVDCVALQSNRTRAHEDSTTNCSAKPSQVHDVSNTRMCYYPAADRSRAFALAQTSRLLQEPADLAMILLDTITFKYSSTPESEAGEDKEARSPQFKSSNTPLDSSKAN